MTPYAEVIGDPIAHSRSPAIHHFWLDQLGMDGDYRALRVTPGDLPAYFEARRRDPAWRGCNVTMPLKEQVMRHLAATAESVVRVGACNVIGADVTGYNSDISGVSEPLQAHGVRPDAAVRIVGTGGAARAAVAGCLAAGLNASSITIHGRNAEKARHIADILLGPSGRSGSIAPEDLAGADILINASPLGMAGYPVVPVEPEGLVFDLVYDPIETPLLAAARRRGLPTIDGLDMLIAQAAAAFAIFFGAAAPRAQDGELRRRLLA